MPGFNLFSFASRKGKGKETNQSATTPRQSDWKAAEAESHKSAFVRDENTAPPPPYLPSDYAPPQSVKNELATYYNGSPDKAKCTVLSSVDTGSSATYKQTDLNEPMGVATKESALDLLHRYDTVVILDDSDSMRAHWDEACRALSQLAGLVSHRDDDGIDIYFVNHERPLLGVKSPSEIEKVFHSVVPTGSTYLGEALDNVLRPYLLKLETTYDNNKEAALKTIKPINFIIITDGMPADAPEDAIIQAGRRLDARNLPLAQVGVQFVQIGNDREGTEYLQMLDDTLNGSRDMVDTTPYFGEVTSDALCKILLGGINRRFDLRAPDGSKRR